MSHVVNVYASCPSVQDHSPGEYRGLLADVARWTEESGFRGILTHTDNATLDPWAVAQLIMANTSALVPLVAVNPIYQHPLSTARTINTFGHLHDRRVDLNLVSGGFVQHLRQAGDTLDHDRRYDRLTEYALALRLLLTSDRPVSLDGEFYRLKTASLSPQLAPDLLPRLFVSGASDASRRAQQALGVTRLTYPQELGAYRGPSPLHNTGVGFGIIARDTPGEAWATAHQRFPRDEVGEELHDYASATAESHWHQDLSDDATAAVIRENTYWLYPFRSYRTFSPYLVGSHDQVAEVLSAYFALGVSTVVLDGLLGQADLHHAAIAFDLAGQVRTADEPAAHR
jgi:alkanesulfonate monooxygenase